VAGISANVTTVAGIAADVTTVAAAIADVSTVATNIADVSTVADNIANINAVGADIANVNAVAGDLANIDAVAAELPDILTKVSKTSATGSAVIPTGTTAERDDPAQEGYFRRNSEIGRWEGYDGSQWGGIGGGATGSGTDEVFVEMSPNVTSSYTISAGKNALVVGPLITASGATVTVPTGQRLVIL
jgi:hypothetical protein